MPNFQKGEKGFAPLILLVILAVGLVAGGSYIVKNNLVTTKNGQVVFNTNKDKNLSDIKIPSPEPENTSASKKVELAEKTVEYKPTDTNEPQFSINPPAGWIKGSGTGNIKLRFDAPQEDKTEVGNTNAHIGANIQVNIEKTNAKNLDEAMADFKAQAAKLPFSIDVQNESKTTLAGEEALYFEILVSVPDLDYKQLESYVKQQSGNEKTLSAQDIKDMMQSFKGKSVGYTILKNGYRVDVGGTAAGWAWDKRAGAIQSSIYTFKFIENPKPEESPKTQQSSKNSSPIPSELSGLARFPEYSPAQKGEYSYSGKAFPKFKINILPDWMQKISEFKEDQSFMMELRPIDNGKNSNAKSLDQAAVLITIRKDNHTSAEQFVIDTFGRSQIREFRKYEIVTNNGHEGRYLEQESESTNLAEYIYLINGFSINISAAAPEKLWSQISSSLKETINSFVFVN